MIGKTIKEYYRVICFFVVVCLVLLTTLYHAYLSDYLNLSILKHHLSFPNAPLTLGEIFSNLSLAFHGYSEGFMRSFLGYFIFGLISSFFIWAGKFSFGLIFKSRDLANISVVKLNFFERFSLYYILGSLIASLLWFVLANGGFLNITTGIIVAAVGFVGFIFEIVRSRLTPLKLWRQAKLSWDQSPIIERFLVIFLFLILLALSTTSYRPPLNTDALNIHASIPNYYIHQGRMVINSYHFYSYFTQNTEMLTLWAFLLKSEFAANLLIWGFLCAFVLLIFGFLKSYTNNLVALVTVFIFLSAPVIVHSTIQLKPDLIVALFIFAHYCCLVKTFDEKSSSSSINYWALLAGILCGGAIGHKLTAIFAAIISSLFIIGYDFYEKRKNPAAKFVFPLWFFGIAITSLPWFLRNVFYTGNPIYPFLTQLFGSTIEDPLYENFRANLFQYNSYPHWTGSTNFLSILLKNDTHAAHAWGPTILLGLLSPLFFQKIHSKGIRYCIVAANLSIIFFLVNKNIEVRYMLGMLAFIVTISFSLNWYLLFKESLSKYFHYFILGTFFFCYCLLFSITSRWSYLYMNIVGVISGYSPGNFATTPDFDLRTIPWITHLINTRTEKNEAVLCAGVYFSYGLQRKTFFGSLFNRDILWDISKKSSDAEEIAASLRESGIGHILISSKFYDPDEYKVKTLFKFNQEESDRIKLFFEKYMTLRFQTPDRSILWYSFHGKKPIPAIILNTDDVEKFPIMAIGEARAQIQDGNINEARDILEVVVNSHMRKYLKHDAYNLLISIYMSKSDQGSLEKTMLAAANDLPMYPETFYNLAVFYENLGPDYLKKAIDYYEKYVNLDSNSPAAYNSLGNLYFQTHQYEKALVSYEKVIELDPNSFQAYNNIGNIFYSVKHFSKSEEFFQKAIEINPNYLIAYENLGKCYAVQKKYEEAREIWKIQAQLQSGNVKK